MSVVMSTYSVIIATHGRPALLTRAIRSIRQPDSGEVTVIVVSDDRSAETCDAARACLSHNDLFIARGGAQGPARSRNLGLAVAESDYILFLDDDDEWPSGFLAALSATGPAPSGSVRFCDFSVAMDADPRTLSTPPVPVAIGLRDAHQVHVMNFIPNSCLIYPIDLVRNLRFDESLILNEDWDFLLAALQGHRLVHVPVQGPIIHSTERNRGDRRGAANDHLLGQVLIRLYQKWPAPTESLRIARQALFAGVGVSLPITDF
jgi:glycosyltransferase involved in cell wall biosynthesis